MIAHLNREVHTVHSHDRISSLRFVHIALSLCRGDANYVRTLREHNLNLTNHFSVVTSIMFLQQCKPFTAVSSAKIHSHTRFSFFSFMFRCKVVLSTVHHVRIRFRLV